MKKMAHEEQADTVLSSDPVDVSAYSDDSDGIASDFDVTELILKRAAHSRATFDVATHLKLARLHYKHVEEDLEVADARAIRVPRRAGVHSAVPSYARPRGPSTRSKRVQERQGNASSATLNSLSPPASARYMRSRSRPGKRHSSHARSHGARVYTPRAPLTSRPGTSNARISARQSPRKRRVDRLARTVPASRVTKTPHAPVDYGSRPRTAIAGLGHVKHRTTRPSFSLIADEDNEPLTRLSRRGRAARTLRLVEKSGLAGAGGRATSSSARKPQHISFSMSQRFSDHPEDEAPINATAEQLSPRKYPSKAKITFVSKAHKPLAASPLLVSGPGPGRYFVAPRESDPASRSWGNGTVAVEFGTMERGLLESYAEARMASLTPGPGSYRVGGGATPRHIPGGSAFSLMQSSKDWAVIDHGVVDQPGPGSYNVPAVTSQPKGVLSMERQVGRAPLVANSSHAGGGGDDPAQTPGPHSYTLPPTVAPSPLEAHNLKSVIPLAPAYSFGRASRNIQLRGSVRQKFLDRKLARQRARERYGGRQQSQEPAFDAAAHKPEARLARLVEQKHRRDERTRAAQIRRQLLLSGERQSMETSQMRQARIAEKENRELSIMLWLGAVAHVSRLRVWIKHKREMEEKVLKHSSAALIQRRWREHRERQIDKKRLRIMKTLFNSRMFTFLMSHRIRRKKKAAAIILRFLYVSRYGRDNLSLQGLLHTFQARIKLVQCFWRRQNVRYRAQLAVAVRQLLAYDKTHSRVRSEVLRDLSKRAQEEEAAAENSRGSAVLHTGTLLYIFCKATKVSDELLERYMPVRRGSIALHQRRRGSLSSTDVPYSTRQHMNTLREHIMATIFADIRRDSSVRSSPGFLTVDTVRAVLAPEMRKRRKEHFAALQMHDRRREAFLNHRGTAAKLQLEQARLALTGRSKVIEDDVNEFLQRDPKPRYSCLLPHSQLPHLLRLCYKRQIEIYYEHILAHYQNRSPRPASELFPEPPAIPPLSDDEDELGAALKRVQDRRRSAFYNGAANGRGRRSILRRSLVPPRSDADSQLEAKLNRLAEMSSQSKHMLDVRVSQSVRTSILMRRKLQEASRPSSRGLLSPVSSSGGSHHRSQTMKMAISALTRTLHRRSTSSASFSGRMSSASSASSRPMARLPSLPDDDQPSDTSTWQIHSTLVQQQ